MDSRHYIVRIYEGEAILISKWMLQYPDVEIGGDLFGHWINEDEIVIEAVVAQNCHTRTPFSQDGQYRSNVEALLNHGLENIGSWHSYSLINKPEACDDVETVWRHQPTPGRFLLLIATVETETGSPKVQMELDVYETTREEYKVVPVINIEILQGQSPIRVNETVNSQMSPSKTSYLEPQNQIPDIQSNLIKPEGSRETRVAAPEIVEPEVNVQRNKEPDVRASPELESQESVRGSRKLEDSEITAEVHAKRTSHPEPSLQSSPSKPKEREASKVRKSKAAGPEAKAEKYRQPNVRVNQGHDDCEDFQNEASDSGDSGRERKKSAPKPKPRLSKAVVNSPTPKSKPNPSSQDSLTNQPKLTLLAARKAPSTDNPGHAVEPLSLGNQSKSSAHTNDSSNTRVAGSAPPSTTNPSQVKSRSSDTSVGPDAPGPQDNPSEPTQDDEVEPMDTDDSDLNPSTDYHAEGQNDTEMDTNDEETLSERESIIQKIYDCLKFWFGTPAESMVKYESSENTPGAVEIRFKHNSKYWMIRFPKDFPANPAKLFYCYDDRSYNKCNDSDIVQPPLTNEVSILLTITKLCGAYNVCESITAYIGQRSRENFAISFNELVKELDKSLHVKSLNANPPLNMNHAEITFEHANKRWIIVLPTQFPNIPAKVHYFRNEDGSQQHDALLRRIPTSAPQDLNTIKLIIQAIQWVVQSSPSKQKGKEESKVSKSKAAGPEANAKKYRQPNVRENEGHDDCKDFFENKALGHRPRHGAKYELPPFTCSVFQRPDGKEGMTFLHHGHPLGTCGECRTMVASQKKDGELYADESRGKRCNIM